MNKIPVQRFPVPVSVSVLNFDHMLHSHSNDNDGFCLKESNDN